MQMRTKSELARMRAWYGQFNNTATRELSDVYASASPAKYRAYNWCLRRWNDKPMTGKFRILGHNCDYFTVGYTWGDENGEAFFTVETYAHTYTCKVSDMD